MDGPIEIIEAIPGSPEGAPPRKKAITMLNYFQKVSPKIAPRTENTNKNKNIIHLPLHLTDEQTLAPAWNSEHIKDFQNPTNLEKFEQVLKVQPERTDSNHKNYLDSLNNVNYKPFKANINKPSRKYIHFYEDVRPPYGGTWRKNSTKISGRNPLGEDLEHFDYEVDSEAEWDVGGPGESLKGDDSEEEEEPDDYEIDMKTFVPHGYVSDDEINCPSDSDKESSGKKKSVCEKVFEDDSMHVVDEVNIPIIPVVTNHENGHQIMGNGAGDKRNKKKQMTPVVIGITYIDNPTVSEEKMKFLQTFSAVL